MATFGLPALILLLLNNTQSQEEKLGTIIKNVFWWCVGYAGMWVSKWVLATAVTKENAIAGALEAVAERTSDSASDTMEQFNVFSCEITNYMTFLKTPVVICLGLFMIYLVCKCVRSNSFSSEEVLKSLFPYVIVGLAPAVWYAFAVNHSSIHFWFTNKACVVSVMALLLGTASLLHKNKA